MTSLRIGNIARLLFVCSAATLTGWGTQYIAIELHTSVELAGSEFLRVESYEHLDKPPQRCQLLQRGPSLRGRWYYDIPVPDASCKQLFIQACASRLPLISAWIYPISEPHVFLDVQARHTYLSDVVINRGTAQHAPLANAVVLNIDYGIDVDGDGLGTTQEMAYKTNPWRSDSDADMLADPVDSTGRVITISIAGQAPFNKSTLGTDPINPDSDHDGVLGWC